MPKNNYSLKFTPISYEDLEQIYNYISDKLYAEASADNLMGKIESAITRLKEFPFSCAYVLDETLKSKGYRKLIVDNYIVFYLVNELEKQVVIMRILYGARDYENFI